MAMQSEEDAVQWLSDEEVIAILDDLPRCPMPAGNALSHLPLAGAQDKLPVVFDGIRIGLPSNSARSSHLLKFAPHAGEDRLANEGFCMALALVMGLRPALSKVHAVRDRTFLLVERYDRVTDEQGRLSRVHHEDFCHALGVVPEVQYQNQGGPDLAQCFALLRKVARPGAPQVLRLLDYVIFNALIGHDEAHGGNFSLLYFGEEAVLAPLHDVLSTAVDPGLASEMAMRLGSTYKFSEIQARDWEQFAQEAELSQALVKARVAELAETLPPAARRLQLNPRQGFAGNSVVERIVGLIEQRCARTISRLT